MVLTLGSSSAILAANAAAIGLSTSFCGTVGNDRYGEFIIQELCEQGVNTEFVLLSQAHQTGITVVLNYDQESANITYCGAMEVLTIDDIPWSALDRFQHLHISNFFLQKGIQADIVTIFQRAKKLGLTTSLDLQWDASNRWAFNFRECLPLVDVFLPNDAELKALTKSEDLEQAIRRIRPYIHTMAVKMGQRGSLGIRGEEQMQVEAYRVPSYIDSVGAGDSFNAGFLKKFLEKASLEACLQYGNLMGALNTTAAGGTAAFKNGAGLEHQIRSFI
jgi:sugar/nucleoside kinase (ribokinase family)